MKAAAAALLAAALCLAACERAGAPAPQSPAKSPPASAATPALIEWEAEKDGNPRSYQAGPFSVTLAKASTEDGLLRPVLTISDGRGPPLTLPGAEGSMATARAEFTAAALDRRSAGPQLLVRTFTYGAHCCFEYKLVERRDGRWLVHDLGQFDGAGMPTPSDVDGDGRLELLGGDQRFLYAFGPYAFSAVPPQVHEIVGGKLVDVSADPRYRSAYEADAAKARKACQANPEPGVCIPYAATMARLGRLEEAWPVILAADPGPEGGDSPVGCWGGRTYCDGDRQIPATSFRHKVELALTGLGYLPKHRPAA